jgi:hypothetical protein
MGSLLDSINNSFTPEVIHRASSMIGEAEAGTRRALQAAASNVVGGLSRLASSREGVENLHALLDKDGYQSLAGNVPALFSGGSVTASTLSAGEQLLQGLFGHEASPVQEQVASAGRVKTASAGKLLALVAPLALGLLAKRASAQGLNASEISRLLTGADKGAADAGERSFHEEQRGRRWGPLLVPKQHKENVRSRAEIPAEPADELPGNDETAAARPKPDSHPMRRIVFLLLALAVLALLILLLIRGPVNRRSNYAQPRTLAVMEAPPLDH